MWSAPESTGSPGFNTGSHTVADMQVSEKQLIKLLKGVFRVNQPVDLLFDPAIRYEKEIIWYSRPNSKVPVLTDEGKEVSFK